MSQDATTGPRRGRSARYPGVPLGEAVEFCKRLDDGGLDGLPAGEIARALGYKNLKTNTFSARLSAARQFGLLTLDGDGYALTARARAILHPVDRAELPRLYRQAFSAPPLYAELAARLADRRVPEATVLANVLYHNHQITAAAKQSAAEAFLASARFAGALGDDGILRPGGPAEAPPPAAAAPTGETPSSRPRTRPAAVRLDLKLWGPDDGKVIRLRAPESITPASFERFLQAFRLMVRIEGPAGD
jgi:hypothetical protein